MADLLLEFGPIASDERVGALNHDQPARLEERHRVEIVEDLGPGRLFAGVR